MIIYCKYILNILNIFNTNLLKLNNIKLNYITLIVIFILFFYSFNKYINYILPLMLLFLIKKFYFYFIKRFYFGFFKIHPILFYTTVIFYTLSFKKNFFNLKFKIINILYVSIISFILGGYWNIFHLPSGLFWSNDSIEILLVMFILVYVNYIHSNTKLVIYNHKYFYLTVVLILLIRFNFIYTKHNFFSLVKKNLKLKMYYIFLVLCNLLIPLKLKITKIMYKNQKIKFLIYMYILLLLFYNYINFFFFKKLNKFLNYLIMVVIMKEISWKNFKKLLLHVIIFLLLFVYNLFYIKYIYNITYVYNKIIFFLKYLLNNVHNKNYYKLLNNTNNVKYHYLIKNSMFLNYRNKYLLN
jgi:hypothetical protein